MNAQDLELMLQESTFQPFVITTFDGFALPVTSYRNALVGLRVLAIKYNGVIYQIPFAAIAHTSEKGERL
jgi:hypothetical protein